MKVARCSPIRLHDMAGEPTVYHPCQEG
jgi:hypothetical protein